MELIPATTDTDPARRRWPRAVAAMFGTLPYLALTLLGGTWLVFVLLDRFVHKSPRSILSYAFNRVLDPSLMILVGLGCIGCIVVLAWRTKLLLPIRLALGTVAIVPAAVAGTYAVWRLHEALFVLSRRIWAEDLILYGSTSILSLLSVSAIAWLVVRRG